MGLKGNFKQVCGYLGRLTLSLLLLPCPSVVPDGVHLLSILLLGELLSVLRAQRLEALLYGSHE